MDFNIGKRIKALRAKNNISQNRLAKELGVDRRTISYWETNKAIMNAKNFINLSDFFGISTEDMRPDRELKIKV